MPRPPAKTPAATRRRPSQARAGRTLLTIFEATAQIVEEQGEQALTTNRIAEVAGFSVGTLYQYFPGKQAILLAMIARERRIVMNELDAMLGEAEREGTEPQELLRRFIRKNIEAFGSGGRVRSAMIRLAWRMDQHDEIAAALRETTDRIALALSRLKHPDVRPASPAALFVVTRAVIGVIRSASLEQSALLGSQEFEDELVRMAWAVLTEATV